MNFCTYSKYYWNNLGISKLTRIHFKCMYHISSIQERNVQWWGWKQTDLCQNPAVRWNRVTFLDDVKFYQKNIKKNYSLEHYTTYPITHFQELNSTLKSTSYDPARLRSAHQLKTESTARKSSFVIFFFVKKKRNWLSKSVFILYFFFEKRKKKFCENILILSDH